MQQLGFVMGAQTTFAPRAHSFPAPWSTVPKVGDNAPSLSPHVSSSKIEPNGSVSCSEPKPNPGSLVSIVSDATPPLLLSYSRISPSIWILIYVVYDISMTIKVFFLYFKVLRAGNHHMTRWTLCTF